jgi:ABC-2 type transport system permease protein
VGSIPTLGSTRGKPRFRIREPVLGGVRSRRSRAQLVALLKVQTKLSLREPYALGVGVGLPAILLIVFGFISRNVPGNVGGTGLTVIDLYIPVIMVISFIGIAISLPSTLVRDREIGWLRRISTTPVHPSQLLGAQLILDLVLAAAAIAIAIVGGTVIFGAPLTVDIPSFILSVALAIAEIFSLGLVVVALVSTQTAASVVGGVLFFALMFLSGLWVQPVQVGGPLEITMWYSPSGAAVWAILYSVFNQAPPVTTLVTLACYTLVFAFVALRYFRWE